MPRTHMGNGVSRYGSGKKAFTLIELLVVISIIAMLVSMLLPSLNRAKDLARAAVCSSNIKGIGQQLALYTTEWSGFPPSYTYPAKDGTYNFFSTTDQSPDGQMLTAANGYQHWSWYIAGKTKLGDKFFSCPIMKNGGMPRTNPGSGPNETASGQIIQNPGVEDKQAPRMAYTANGAIIPRNKFTLALAAADGIDTTDRTNRFVSPEEIANSSGVILMTEFIDNWRAICKSGNVIKSHRPVSVFGNISASNDYGAMANDPCYMYGKVADTTQKGDFNLKPYSAMMSASPPVLIDGQPGDEVNCVGRHHPGGDKYGGTANFLYVDGHVARKTILETLKGREWGHRYYGMTGKNKVYEDDWSSDSDN